MPPRSCVRSECIMLQCASQLPHLSSPEKFHDGSVHTTSSPRFKFLWKSSNRNDSIPGTLFSVGCKVGKHFTNGVLCCRISCHYIIWTWLTTACHQYTRWVAMVKIAWLYSQWNPQMLHRKIRSPIDFIDHVMLWILHNESVSPSSLILSWWLDNQNIIG